MTPKQDLTVDELDEIMLRHGSKCIALEYPNEVPMASLVAAARKGVEASQCICPPVGWTEKCPTHGYSKYATPQKPEPSGREDGRFPATGLEPPGCPTPGACSCPPSPTPGDKDAVTTEDLAKGFVAFKDGKKITAEEFYKEPSDSVEGLVKRLEEEGERLSGHSMDRGVVESGLAANLAMEAAEGLKRMEQERDIAQSNTDAAIEDYNDMKAERDRLSLEVGRLRDKVMQAGNVVNYHKCPHCDLAAKILRSALAGGAEK